MKGNGRESLINIRVVLIIWMAMIVLSTLPNMILHKDRKNLEETEGIHTHTQGKLGEGTPLSKPPMEDREEEKGQEKEDIKVQGQEENFYGDEGESAPEDNNDLGDMQQNLPEDRPNPTEDSQRPSQVQGVVVKPLGSNRIEITWQWVEEGEKYYVYRSNSPHGPWEKIASTKENRYLDEEVMASTTYWYGIRSENDRGEGELSLVHEGTTWNTRGNTTGNIINNGYVAKQGDWIYYGNPAHDYKLYKKRVSGEDNTILCDHSAAFINVIGEWVYFGRKEDNNIYKIKTDGSQLTLLSTDYGRYINVVDGHLYYRNESQGGKLYGMKVDGTEREEISSEVCSFINVVEDCIYYYDSNNIGVYRIRLDDGEVTKISEDFAMYLIVQRPWMYYIYRTFDIQLYIVKKEWEDISSKRNVIYQGACKRINVQGQNMYFLSLTNHLYRIKMEDGQEERVMEEKIAYYYIFEDFLYYIPTNKEILCQEKSMDLIPNL